MFFSNKYHLPILIIVLTCSHNRLTWHNGLIPETEVWIKMDGDRGANTVKIFQLFNVPQPNSVQNTCVFTVFRGQRHNHQPACRSGQIFSTASRSSVEVKYYIHRHKRVRVLMTGDYEFLSKMYGLSGAQGIYKCRCTGK